MVRKTTLVLMLMLLPVSILGIWMRPTVAQPLDPLLWDPYTRLSYTLTETRWAMVTANERYDPNYIVVVFTDNLAGQFDWYFTKSTDGGETWTTPEIAVNPDFDVMTDELNCAAIAMDDNGKVHMSFARQKTVWPRDTAPTGIYYAKYDGTSWSAPIPIYENMSPGYLCLYTNDITIGRNNIVHLAYGSDYPGDDNGDVWYSRSEDGGLTWTTPENINAFNWFDCGMPLSLAADDLGYLYYATGDDWYNVAWTGETYFRRSQDDGVTWDPQMVITRRENGDYRPRLMCNNTGGVYVVWNGYPSPNSLLFKYSIDHGSNWIPYYGGITLMEDAPGMGSDYFAEIDDYGFIHIVYSSTATETRETYYMKIDTSGNIIIPSQIITPDDACPSHPTGLAVIGDQVYVVTKDLKDGNWEAYFLGLPLTYCELTVTSSPITGITFTIDGAPQTTPYTGSMPEGSYVVVMPETYNGYVWSHWLEDEDPSRTKMIILSGSTVLTGVFEFAVPPAGPIADFTAIPEIANVGESVKFDASSAQPGWNGTHEMPITEYRWDFGDGNKTTISIPIVYHSFTDSGNYYVELTVYALDATPETDTVTHRVIVVFIPVGGYSILVNTPTTATPITSCFIMVAILAFIFIKVRHKKTLKSA
ncbi:MAG: PKD domain-containing protein [Candidatus Bathyarchaeota archaeon]|nr:PKD domain-containing protein [Candidatus Bathyarchaeota archaeon]MDH5787456.1 PKD domain-containing protein [Candidatus Bathyarchaeota archaeon]